jgi:hypothetical protein
MVQGRKHVLHFLRVNDPLTSPILEYLDTAGEDQWLILKWVRAYLLGAYQVRKTFPPLGDYALNNLAQIACDKIDI